MGSKLQRLSLLRFRAWLNNGSFREHVYPLIIAGFIYSVALMGGVIIGGTSYGIFLLGGIAALIVGMMIALSPAVGVYILIFFIFANLSDILEEKFSIPDSNKLLVALVLVGVLARRVLIDKKPIILRGTEFSVIAVGLALGLSLAFRVDPGHARIVPLEEGVATPLSVTTDWLKDFVIFFIIVQFSLEEKSWKNTHVVLIGTAAFLSILSVYQVITGDVGNDFYGLAVAPDEEIVAGQDGTRITGPITDPNYYAMVLLMTLPLAFYIGFTAYKTSTKVIYGLGGLVILAAVLFTLSRGAFLALFAVGGLIVLERKMNPYRIGLIVLVLFAIFYPVAPDDMTTRINTIPDLFTTESRQQTDSSFRGRTNELLVAILMFEDRPLTGVGRGNYSNLYLDYTSRVGLDNRFEAREAHSLYFETLAEQGIIGFIVFMFMLFMIYRGLSRAKELLRTMNRDDLVARVAGVQFGLTGYLVASLFLHGAFQRYFYLIIALAAAASAFAENLYAEHEAEANERQQPQGEPAYQLVDATELS